ncbi:MAG: SH3 domain-containing protein [Phormidesmis sp.]
MKNFFLGLSKFILGIILAMLIMSLAGAAMVRYFMARSAEPPERPIYDNDLPEDRAAAVSPQESSQEAAPEPESPAQPTATDSEPETEAAPAGSYTAYVTQPVGLILRDGPGTEYTNIGGVGYEASLTVLEEENGWLKVQLSSGQEGWVKDGNTARE